MSGRGSRLSFSHGSPGPAFAVDRIRLDPDEARPYRAEEWDDSLVVVETGTIELETTDGRRVRFRAGAVLHLTGLLLHRLRNCGREPAVLSAVTRRGRGLPVRGLESMAQSAK